MKAILVIDLPNNLDIPLEEIGADITVFSKDIRKSMLYLKYKNIELRPLPHKLEPNTDDEPSLIDGWNECLDVITGDTDADS